MSLFNVGDKIECLRAGCENLTKGKVYVVTGTTEYWVLVNSDKGTDCWYDPTRFKLYKEKQMFDMKNENWYVAPKSKAEYAVTQEYLFAQGFRWSA